MSTPRMIVVASPKGGVGKTTLALTIAGLLIAAGQRVAVLDADPQGSCLAWAALGEAVGGTQPFPVLRSRAAGLVVDTWIVDTRPDECRNAGSSKRIASCCPCCPMP